MIVSRGRERYDIVVVGGGHNALVAAAYLGQAGLSVCVLERAAQLGGAAVGSRPFPGLDVCPSRYAYLVSLLPDRIVADLGLRVRLASRPVASFTPVRRDGVDLGLVVEGHPGPATAESFRALTGSDGEHRAWLGFHEDLARIARAVEPTLLEPLPPATELRRRVGADLWWRFVARPLGETLEETFRDDAVRGVVLTDGLIGTFSSAHDPTLVQNRCFLYHVIGNGTGEWRVPVGGMGAVATALEDAARRAGADLVTEAEVIGLAVDGHSAEVVYASGGEQHRVIGRVALAGVAPAVLDRLRGRVPATAPEGAQVKLNMALDRLPRLRSGHDAAVAFAGTFHLDEGYATLGAAHAAASSGELPHPLPAELYCHTLTDRSILGPGPAERGMHTLTLFGLQVPARLFGRVGGGDAAAALDTVVEDYLAGLDAYLAEPLAECLARDADGRPCLEAIGPPDLEAALAVPGGHIFHGDLDWPWAEDDGDEPAGRPGGWGVETDVDNLLVCGAGARRAGGVSGIGGHNAAMAVLERWRAGRLPFR